MEIVRLAEPRRLPPLRPAAIGLAVLFNGGLLVVLALSRQFAPPHEDRTPPIDVLLVGPQATQPPKISKPSPKTAAPPTRSRPPRAPRTAPASAPRPGSLPVMREKDHAAEAAPALKNFACALLPSKLRDLRPDCTSEGDPFASRIGRATAGRDGQDLRDRPLGDLIGGRFAGKDRYQVEVMLGLRSTRAGIKYHIPVDYGPADKLGDLTNSDGVFGRSPVDPDDTGR